jgi:hypothetical protein
MDELTQLKTQVQLLQARLDRLEKSDRYTFEKTIQILDGRNIQLGIATGTKIGTAATQRIGFYGVAPVAQQVRPTNAATIITTGTTLGLWA